MESLLRKNERRRLQIAEILYEKNDWMTLTELAKALGSSVRSIKYDLDVFKENFDDFTIQTSNHGVRIHFHRNKSLRTLYSNILRHSIPFTLLEIIFADETYSTNDLAERLYISPSTLYRMIDHINESLNKYGIRVDTNPCRIVGNEDHIRLFFYQYFYEKYIYLDWSEFEENEFIDNLLHFAITYTNYQIDFALYGVLKVIATINYIRYKNKHRIKINSAKINLERILPSYRTIQFSNDYFEKNLGRKIDYQLITQLFKPFVEEGYSINYESLMEKTTDNPQMAKEVAYLDSFLEELAYDRQLPLPNKEEMILGIQNARHMENSDPRMGYILYDRNRLFAADIQHNFPKFYKRLCEGLEKYRALCSLPATEDGLNYLIYITYSYWQSLTINLRRKHQKIKVLVISNRHTAHSHMLSDFISYEFSRQLEIDVYLDVFLTRDILENLEHDFVIANFPLPRLTSKSTLLIESIPGAHDLSKIQEEINRIREKRNLNGYDLR